MFSIIRREAQRYNIGILHYYCSFYDVLISLLNKVLDRYYFSLVPTIDTLNNIILYVFKIPFVYISCVYSFLIKLKWLYCVFLYKN